MRRLLSALVLAVVATAPAATRDNRTYGLPERCPQHRSRRPGTFYGRPHTVHIHQMHHLRAQTAASSATPPPGVLSSVSIPARRPAKPARALGTSWITSWH